jgi:hypothetical protein
VTVPGQILVHKDRVKRKEFLFVAKYQSLFEASIDARKQASFGFWFAVRILEIEFETFC